MRVVTCLFLLVIMIGCFTEGTNEVSGAMDTYALRELDAADTIEKTGRAKRGIVMTILGKAGSFILSVKSAAKNKVVKEGMEMDMDEIKLDIANSQGSLKGNLMESEFENTVNKPAKNLIDMLEKFAKHENRATKIKSFISIETDSEINNIMKNIEFLITKEENLLNITLRNDPYHRKSTLVSMQNKITSIMKLTIFAHAVRVSLRGNSTKMIDYIEKRWSKGNVLNSFNERLANITIFDEVALRDDTPEPETEIHFPDLMERFMTVSKFMDAQIEQQLFEDSFWKVRNLVEITMTEVEKNDLDDSEMRKAKVAKLKQNLDDIDRYFVLAHAQPFLVFDRMKYDTPNSQKENLVVAKGHSIVVFRAQPKENYKDKASKHEGKVLSQQTDCCPSMPSRDNNNGSRIVISVFGDHAFMSDLDYKTVRDDPSKCHPMHPCYRSLVPSFVAHVAHTAYIIYG